MASASKAKSMSIPRTSNMTTSSTPERKARTLTARQATHAPTYKSTSGIEDTGTDAGTSNNGANAAREAERLNSILGNLSVKFLNCTFTYKDAHLVEMRGKVKEKSKLKKWMAKSKSTLSRLEKAIGIQESEFKSCIYVPKSEEDQVRQFVRKNFTDTKIKFENCRYIKRGSTFFEKVAKRLRGVFGIIFELTYPDNSAVVEEYTFRLKDISVITQYVQERIVEKG